MEEKPFLVLGLGEILWDMLPEGKQLGGAPANFAFHAGELGADSRVISCIGSDPLGQEIRETLHVNGVSVDGIAEDPAHPTGTVSITLEDGGVPTYTIHEGVAWDFIPTLRAYTDMAASADAVCFGSLASRSPYSRESIRRMLDATMPRCLRVFDVNLRQKYYTQDLIQALMERADVLKLNEDELPIITEFLNIDGSSKQRMERMAAEYALTAVALTRGARGSVLIADDLLEVHHGTRIEDMGDTVGAGDSFTAALAMGLLRGHSLKEISDHANRLAAYVCSQHGAMASHPLEGV